MSRARPFLLGLAPAIAIAGVLGAPGVRPAVAVAGAGAGAGAGARAAPRDAVSARVASEAARRAQAWSLVEALARTTGAQTAGRIAWHSSAAVFASDAAAAGRRTPPTTHTGAGSRAPRVAALQTGEPQILIETYYNEVAYRHVRANSLQRRQTLERLRRHGAPDPRVAGNRSIPPLPDGSMIVLAAWWPVARERPSPLPVWDPEANPPLPRGNHYLTWKRVVALVPERAVAPGATAPVDFAGRRLEAAPQVALARLLHVEVDAARAARAMRDPRLRQVAVLALGRPLAAGDRLALVAAHVIGKSGGRWQWATLWWHDRPGEGAFATGRPAALAGAWREYLMDAPADPDAESYREASAAPGEPSFNPWLEARFPDGGAGGGVASHCIVCHRRASYPAVRFLPVTQAATDAAGDAAFAPRQLRTDFIWGIARHPGSAPPLDGAYSDDLLIERLR